MSSSAKMLRLLRRTFLADCDNARKVLTTGMVVPGQGPDTLFAYAQESYENAITAYVDAIKALDRSTDAERIEILNDSISNFEQSFYSLQESYTKYYQEHERKTESQNHPDNLDTRSIASCSSLNSSRTSLHSDVSEDSVIDLKKKQMLEIKRKQLEVQQTQLQVLELEQQAELDEQMRQLQLQKGLQQRDSVVQSVCDNKVAYNKHKYTEIPIIVMKDEPSSSKSNDQHRKSDLSSVTVPKATYFTEQSFIPLAKPKISHIPEKRSSQIIGESANDMCVQLVNATNALTSLSAKQIEGVGRTFSGDYNQFRSFKRETERDLKRVGSHDNLLDILEKRCIGKALTTLRANRDRHLNPKVAYEETMKSFEKLYGNPRLVLKQLYSNLTKEKRALWNTQSLHDLYIEVYEGLMSDNDDDEWKTKLNGRETVEIIIKRRLPTQSRKRLANKLHNQNKIFMTYNELIEFILEEVDRTTHFMFEEFVETEDKHKNKRQEKRAPFKMHALQDEEKGSDSEDSGKKKRYPCPACKGDANHSLGNCDAFKKLSVHNRWQLIKKSSRCISCLHYGHVSKDCKYARICKHCKEKKHHYLLCGKQPPEKPKENSRSPPKSQGNVSCISYSLNVKRERYVPVANVKLRCKSSGKKRIVTMLLDTGSDVTLLKMQTAQKLNVTGEKIDIWITTGSGTDSYPAIIADFEVSSLNDEKYYDLPGVRCLSGMNLTHSNPIRSKADTEKFPYLDGFDLPYFQSDVIELVIGTCHARLQELKEPIYPPEGNGPVVSKSVFGHMIVGYEDNCQVYHHHLNRLQSKFIDDSLCSGDINTCELLHKEINQHFYSDYLFSADDNLICPSLDDDVAIKKLKSSIVNVGNKWEVALPIKDEKLKLPNNYSYAEKRLKILCRMLDKKPELKSFYVNKMKDLISTNLERVENPRVLFDNLGLVWYISHFATKQKKPRIVYDGPAQYMGYSLNMILYDGPDMLSKLWEVLLRFREGKIAFTLDLKNMFMSVGIRPEHRDLLRILWYDDPSDTNSKIAVYRFKDLVYGLNCSQFISTFCLQETAVVNETNACEKAVSMTNTSYYVDDGLESVNSVEEAIECINDHIKLLKSRNFHVHKIISNSRDVLKNVDKESLAEKLQCIELDFDDLPEQKVLGVGWDPENDELVVKVNIIEKPFTKRGFWSMIQQQFDPHGLCDPFMLPGKKILQQLCKTNKEWDTPVPPDILKEWKKWYAGLKQLEKIHLPRWVGSADKYELHGFCDASTVGKGCVMFLRAISVERIKVSFLVGKSLVVPSDVTTSVPKLELLAADLVSKQHVRVKAALRIEINQSYFWSDSSTVLHWINNTSKRHPKFIARRLENIRRNSCPDEWRYVPTELNPADLASRGADPSKADVNHIWFQGPPFLHERDEASWPTLSLMSKNEIEEVEKVAIMSMPSDFCCYSHNASENDDAVEIKSVCNSDQVKGNKKFHPVPTYIKGVVQNSSSIYDICKRVAYRSRYVINRCLAPCHIAESVDGPLTANELDKAILDVVRCSQEQYFGFDILTSFREKGLEYALNKYKGTEEGKRLQLIKNLVPFVDGQFVLRVGGRMQNSDFPYDIMHQIILPRRHKITKMLIVKEHNESGHLGHNFVLTQLMKKYWVIHGVCTVKHYIEDCLYCQERRLKPEQQIMSPLPAGRVTKPSHPFEHVGIDLWGPMLVQIRRSQVKRWGLILTCLASRACHLEVVEDLTTSAFIQSLIRFLNRRGQCTKCIYSDCGSNFKGAEDEFKSMMKLIDSDQLKVLGLDSSAIAENLAASEFFKSLDVPRIETVLLRRHVEIKWKFNCPKASAAGGVWERMIRETRKVLRAILIKGMQGVPAINRRTPTDFELQTILTEIECILNNRPITRLSDNISDYQALTPQMILTGVLHPSVPTHRFSKADEFRKNWRYTQIVSEQFWNRWLLMYLPWLQVRSKWFKKVPNLKVGDLVLSLDDASEGRLDFPKAIVHSICPDKFGNVRQVQIRFSNGKIFDRPIQKIVKLEVDTEC